MNKNQTLHNQTQKNYSPKVQRLLHILILLWIVAGTLLPLVAFSRTKDIAVLLSFILLILPTYIIFHDKKLFHGKGRKETLIIESIIITLSTAYVLFTGLPVQYNNILENSAVPAMSNTSVNITPFTATLSSNPTQTAEIFCNDITYHSYNDIYSNLFTEALQEKTSPSQLESTFFKIESCVRASTSQRIEENTKATIPIVFLSVSDGPSEGHLNLTKERNTWKINQIFLADTSIPTSSPPNQSPGR